MRIAKVTKIYTKRNMFGWEVNIKRKRYSKLYFYKL